MEKNWLDEVFGDTTDTFNYFEYSPKVLIKVFKLNEPKIISAIKGLLRIFVAFISAVALVILLISVVTPIKLNDKPTTPAVDQTDSINNYVNDEDRVIPPVVDTKNDESSSNINIENVEISTNETLEDNWLDNYMPNYNTSTNTQSSFLGNVFGLLFESVIDTIENVDLNKLDVFLKDVGALVIKPDSEEAMAVVNRYKDVLKDEINNSALDDKSKSVLIGAIDALDVDWATTRSLISNFLDSVHEGIFKINKVITYIMDGNANGSALTPEEIVAIFEETFIV